MKSPYGLPCIESCLSCKLRTDDFFCALSQESLEAFNQIKHGAVFPAKPFRNTPRQASSKPSAWSLGTRWMHRTACGVSSLFPNPCTFDQSSNWHRYRFLF